VYAHVNKIKIKTNKQTKKTNVVTAGLFHLRAHDAVGLGTNNTPIKRKDLF
jgi:hypothetical protein